MISISIIFKGGWSHWIEVPHILGKMFSKTLYSGTPPYDHPVYKTTSLLRPYSFKPNVKNIESFYYFEDPVNATTSLLRPGFYGPTVVVLTGFHCISKQARDAWWERLLVHNQSPPSFSDWIFPHQFFFFFQNIAKTRVSRPWWPLDGGSKNWRINALEGIDNDWWKWLLNIGDRLMEIQLGKKLSLSRSLSPLS